MNRYFETPCLEPLTADALTRAVRERPDIYNETFARHSHRIQISDMFSEWENSEFQTTINPPHVTGSVFEVFDAVIDETPYIGSHPPTSPHHDEVLPYAIVIDAFHDSCHGRFDTPDMILLYPRITRAGEMTCVGQNIVDVEFNTIGHVRRVIDRFTTKDFESGILFLLGENDARQIHNNLLQHIALDTL